MALGAAAHFAQQGWPISSTLQTASALRVRNIRDGVSWSDIERTAGEYDFSAPSVSYVDGVVQQGMPMTLVLAGGNPNYDQGHTPYSDAGREAFARWIVAVLDRFPSVSAIEIGNEYNAQNFVTGPVANADYGQRQVYYAKMLKAVHGAVKAKHPRVRILGGAALGIPVGYYKVLFDEGALNWMDELVIHPYTTEPEQFSRQLAQLKRAMGDKVRPIYATEFSRQLDSRKATADYLVKMVSVMAEAGVAGADWYALLQQGPADALWYKQVALSDLAGNLTEVGRGFQMMQTKVLSQGTPVRVSIDDFTYAYQFGRNVIVLWGEPRSFSFKGQAQFYDSTGQPVEQATTIDQNSPIVIVSQEPIVIGCNLILDATALVADSFDQFDYENSASKSGNYAGRWAYYAFSVARSRLEPLSGLGGGEVPWSHWTPFVSDPWRRPLAIQPESLQPADFSADSRFDPYKVVLRYTAQQDQTVAIQTTWSVSDQSLDGMDLTVKLNDSNVATTLLSGVSRNRWSDVRLRSGDKLDFYIGQNITINGDMVNYRIKLYRS